MKSKIVVVVCARNEQENLPSLLSSLWIQTIRPYKIVIVDDGSTDYTNRIIKEWQETTDNWVFLLTRKNRCGKGNLAGTPEMAVAFNKGFEMVDVNDWEYSYLMICGADDKYQPDYIERILKKFEENSNLVIASGLPKGIKTKVSRTGVFGAGRMIKGKFWDLYGRRYDYPSWFWESKILYLALKEGYDVRAYNDIEFETRPLMQKYGEERYGIKHRSSGYPLKFVLKRMWDLLRQKNISAVWHYARGYCRKPERVIVEDLEFSKEIMRIRKKVLRERKNKAGE